MTEWATIVLVLAQATGGDASSAAPPTPPQSPHPTFDILIWLSVLLAAVIVGYLVAMYFRSRVHASSDGGIKSTFTLAELRQLHAAGHLTDDEFARARDRVLQISGYATIAEPADQTEPTSDLASQPCEPSTAPPAAAEHPAHDDLGPELLADPDAAGPANPGEFDPDRAKRDSHIADEDESDRRID